MVAKTTFYLLEKISLVVLTEVTEIWRKENTIFLPSVCENADFGILRGIIILI